MARVQYLEPVKFTDGQAELILSLTVSCIVRCDDDLGELARIGAGSDNPESVRLRMQKRRAENIVKKMQEALAGKRHG